WSYVHFGTVVQVSGAAKRALDLYGRLPRVTGIRQVFANLYGIFDNVSRFVVGEQWEKSHKGRWVLALLTLFLLGALASSRRLRGPKVLLPLYALAAMHLAAYALYFHAYYHWYFLPVVFVGAVLQG